MSDFVIDQVSWHLDTPGNPETPEAIRARFRAVIEFLQANKLCVHELLAEGADIQPDLAIRNSDLTEAGLLLMKACYDRWLRKIDKGMSPTDTRLLEQQLQKQARGAK